MNTGYRVFFIIGIISVITGFGGALYEHLIILRSKIVTGSVIELVPSKDSKGRTQYAPTVHFKTREGRDVIFKSDYSSSKGDRYIGEVVYIAYDNLNPEKAVIFLFEYTFALYFTLVVYGLGMIFVGYGLLYGDEWIRRIYLSKLFTISING